jgi:hypothetical protein
LWGNFEMKKIWLCGAMLGGAALAAVMVAGQGAPSGPPSTPTVNVGPAVAAKAANPTPGATAKNQTQKTSIGKGAASEKASEPSAYWSELVDIDGDGVKEDNQFLFDKQRGVLYTYREDKFQCADGTPQHGDVLMGIYSQGNVMGRPVGAGWFVVAVKTGQCGEKKAGLFGCWFDATGKPSRCGTARVKDESGELEVVVKR